MASISRREFMREAATASAALALTGTGCLSSGNTIGRKHPNLVFVFPDQMRGQALGFLKEEPVITPDLDRFAGESLVLPQAVSNYPVCSPYRAMLMTGKFPHANKVLTNCTSDSAPFNYQLQKSDR